jgi:hypothetical protein
MVGLYWQLLGSPLEVLSSNSPGAAVRNLCRDIQIPMSRG